ncbi:MAG: O-methyltransferase [Chitinophagaceae bacterium]|nr:O-methyltransferase [Chitinophagaceae bacterium]
MDLINDLVEKYIEQWSSKDNDDLWVIHEQTLRNHPKNHMQSSWVQGKLLSFLSQLSKPKYILEIGTFTGFSALCLAKGLQEDGVLHTIEIREQDAKIAQANFSISKNKNQILLHLGNAVEIIPTLKVQWDLVFIDADKTGYIDYYELVLPSLHPNGLIIADNVLFHGDVLQENIKGKNAKAIHAFNEHVSKDARSEQIILSVRDGLMLIKKK